GSNGTFEVTVSAAGIVLGDSFVAAAGSPAGPASNTVIATSSSSIAASPISPIAGGATIVPVSGTPGDVVMIVDTTTQEVLGVGVIGANGQGAITLNPAAPAGDNIEVVTGGSLDSNFVVGATGSAPLVTASGA